VCESGSTIAVVGASGFLGGAVCDELERRGHAVRRLAAPRLRVPNAKPPEIEALAREAASALEQQLRGAGVVINAAGISDPYSAWTSELVGANVALPLSLHMAAARAGLRLMVHVSSAAAQGQGVLDETSRVSPFSAYSASKAMAENFLAAADAPSLAVTIVRPTGVHAKERPTTQRLARLAASRFASVAKPEAPSPQALLSNVASAIAFVAEHPSPPTHVAYPNEGLTCALLLEALGGKSPRQIPARPAEWLLRTLALVGARSALLRRLQVLWFGQPTRAAWLLSQGWRPPDRIEAWTALGSSLAKEAVSEPPAIVLGVTESLQVPYLGRTPEAFVEAGWSVHVVSGPGIELERKTTSVATHPVPMVRDPRPMSDAVALLRWCQLLRQVRPAVVLLGTPKAALLGLLAARVVRVPVKIYLVRGLRLESARGAKAALLWLMERLTVLAADDVLAVSRSLLERCGELRLVGRTPARVIGAGSSHGIDLAQFNPAEFAAERRLESRRALGFGADDFVVGFVGRVRRDKGVPELVEAFQMLRVDRPQRLVVLGRLEDTQALDRFSTPENTVILEHVDDVRPIMSTFDVLCLPSHREGFPNVVLEAGALGIPSVVTDVTGMADSVIHGETGYVVPRRDVSAIAAALGSLAAEEERQRMGHNALVRVKQEFDDVVVNAGFVAHVGELMAQGGIGRRT